MAMKVFAVRDVKADAFGALICCATRGLALRSFADAVLDTRGGNPMRQYPADFALYELGDYDQNSGMIKALPLPAHVASAASVLDTPNRALVADVKSDRVGEVA